MRWGINEGPRKHQLKAGDESRPWKTYSQLWNEHRYTRGALDKLMLAGAVPWVDGEDLLQFLAPSMDAAKRLGGNPEEHLAAEARRLGIERGQPYYDMQAYLAFSALDMLVPRPLNPGVGLEVSADDEARTAKYLQGERERQARELGKTVLVSAQRVCGKCNSEIPAGLYPPAKRAGETLSETCPVCDATAHQLELLERSRKGPNQPP